MGKMMRAMVRMRMRMARTRMIRMGKMMRAMMRMRMRMARMRMRIRMMWMLMMSTSTRL